jgi:hypothetical protein
LLEDFCVGKTDYTKWAPAAIDIALRVQDVRIRNYVNTGATGPVLLLNNGATNTVETSGSTVQTGTSFSVSENRIDDLRIN